MYKRGALTIATGALAIGLVGCTALAPAARPATQPTPAAGQVAPSQPGTAPGVVPAGEAVRAQGAVPAQIAPVPPAPAPPPAAGSAGLTVVGEGTVQAPPDVAYVSAGVQSRGATAREAQDANTAAMNQVLARIKGARHRRAGHQDQRRQPAAALRPQPEPADRLHGLNQVTVTVQDVKRAGEVLDQAISAGANQSAGVRFGLKDNSAAPPPGARPGGQVVPRDRRRDRGAAGLRVSGIIAMSDEGGSGGPQPYERAVPMAAAAAQADVPLQPGQLSVTARVRVVYHSSSRASEIGETAGRNRSTDDRHLSALAVFLHCVMAIRGRTGPGRRH